MSNTIFCYYNNQKIFSFTFNKEYFMNNYKSKYYSIIEKLVDYLQEYYKDNLISIVLYGSVGRDRFTPESDIDIMIILNKAPKGRFNRFNEYYENVYLKLEEEIKSLLKEGINIHISPLIKTKEETEYGSPLFIEMTETCKILFDRDNYFNCILDRLREKLKKYKSEKVPFKGGYYWKLKPDYKKGDIIEL